MARNVKPGITFYRMDAGHIMNKKVRLLVNEFKTDGYYIWKSLVDYAYLHYGYYFPLSNKDELELFATDYCKMNISTVKEVISGCIRRGLFDKRVADVFGILTSAMMQEVYVYGTAERRRQGSEFVMQQDWLLIDFKNKIPAGIALVHVKNEHLSASDSNSSREESTDKTKQDKTRQNKTFAQTQGVAPPDVRAKKEKQPVDTEPFWDKMVAAWFCFNKEKFGIEPSFKARDPKFFKTIIGNLKKRAAAKNVAWTEQVAVERLQNFLKHAFADEWLKKHFILKNLDEQFDVIIQKGVAKPKNAPRIVDSLARDINYLYEMYLDNAVSIRSIEVSHFNYISRHCKKDWTDEEKLQIQEEALRWLQAEQIACSEMQLDAYCRCFAVLEFFKQEKLNGRKIIFGEETVVHA